jgi:hypothetical protein
MSWLPKSNPFPIWVQVLSVGQIREGSGSGGKPIAAAESEVLQAFPECADRLVAEIADSIARPVLRVGT